MNTEMMLDILSGIEEKLIDEYFVIGEKARNAKILKRIWMRLGAAVACLALVMSVYIYLFVPLSAIETRAVTLEFKIGDLNAVYVYKQVGAMSNFEKWTLNQNLGERFQIEYRTLYKLKGHDDIEKLIVFDSIGNCNLIEFQRFLDDDGLTVNVDLTMGYVLDVIYNITSADDIRSVTFSKADWQIGNGIEKDVKISTETVRDRAQIDRIFSIFCSLKYPAKEYNDSYISPSHSDYLNGTSPLSVQTNRKMTVKLYDGRTFEWEFEPFGKCVDMGKTAPIYGDMSDEDLEWLIETIGIDTEYRNWGIPKDEERVSDAETASPTEP